MRRYQKIWIALLNNPLGKKVKLKVDKSLQKRIRKAVYKEKDLDDVNSKKYRLHCEMRPMDNEMFFHLTLTSSLENI